MEHVERDRRAKERGRMKRLSIETTQPAQGNTVGARTKKITEALMLEHSLATTISKGLKES